MIFETFLDSSAGKDRTFRDFYNKFRVQDKATRPNDYSLRQRLLHEIAEEAAAESNQSGHDGTGLLL